MVKKTTILFTLLVLAYTGFAQTYPVNVSTTLTPPYSVYLADYVAPGSDRLAVNIFLGDINRPELQVKLRLRIEGQGIIIETKAGYLPPPLILQGGIPQRLIATDLADYLAPQNLNFQGITRQQFERTGALPEGLYRFCFEVLEYNRGVKISNTGCTMAWMILNDPPLINLPRQNEKIRPQDPQFITFQWTPRHTGSPNSAFSTEYEFSMVELWPATRNPNDAIFTMPPIHQVTTQSTMLIYGPAETPLVAGRSYAFRIKAKSIVGVDELDLFKNNGYSEVFTFTYGDACTLPKNISAEAVNAGKFKVTWQANYNHSGFSVRYKLADNPTAEWYEEDTFFEEIEIDGLQPETTYEYQVSGSCGAFTSEFSAIAKVTTPALPEVNFTCGLPPENFQLDNTTPVEGLKVGDVIKAGDFDVKVVELTPNGNRYTGKGNVVVPYLDNLLVSVDFLNIEVNTDYRLFAGEMDIIGIGLDIIPPELSELLDKLDEGLATLDDLLGDISEGLDLADEILDAVGGLANDIMDNGPFTPDEEAELDGISVEEYNQKAKEALADAIGAMANAKATDDYEVVARKVAQALTLKKRGNKLKNIYNTADTLNVIAVAFYENTMYGFDAQQYPQHRLHYTIIVTDSTDATTNTAIPWAAVKEKEEVTVKARLIPDKGIAADNIIFKTAEGGALTANRNGDEWTVQLPQLTHEQILSINAIDSETNQTVGKLQAIGYTPIEKRVILVAVNGQSTPSISQVESYLNTHYKQAVASWKVEIGNPLQVDGFDGTLQDSEQATLSTYSTGMKTIIRAFTKDTTTIDKEAFYLFMIDKSSEGNAGYMPRKHRYGFIYMGETQTNVNRTIAHELGHGAFRLQHTWEEYPNIAQSTSQNLMDYSGGTTLRKYQWDLIHNPPLVIGLVEDMSEGAYGAFEYVAGFNVISGTFNLHILTSSSNYISFVSRAGKLITIPKDSRDVTFYEQGTLLGFTTKKDGVDVRFLGAIYTKDENKGNFAGYIKEAATLEDYDKSVYKDEYSKLIEETTANATVYLGIVNNSATNNSGCGIDIFEGQFPLADISGNTTGGNNLPKATTNDIKGKLVGSYTETVNNIYGNKVKHIKVVESLQACLCDQGEKFINNFAKYVKSDAEFQALSQTANTICNLQELSILEAFNDENDAEFTKQVSGWLLWGSETARLTILRENFWTQPNAWQIYYNKLDLMLEVFLNFKVAIAEGKLTNKNLQAMVNARTTEFLNLYTIEERIEIIKNLLPQDAEAYTAGGSKNWANYYVGNSEENAIIKVLQSVKTSEDADKMITAISTGFISTLDNHLSDFGFGGNNYTQLTKQYRRLVLLQNAITDETAKQYIADHDNICFLVWNDDNLFLPKNNNGIYKFDNIDVNSNNIKIEYKIASNCIATGGEDNGMGGQTPTVTTCDWPSQTPIDLNYFTPIVVTVAGKFSDYLPQEITDEAARGIITYAGFIKYLDTKKLNDQILTLADYTITGVSLAFGVGELLIAIRTGATVGRVALISWELGGEIIEASINTQAFRTWCAANPSECSNLKTLSLINQIATLSAGGVLIKNNWSVIKSGYKKWDNFPNLKIWNKSLDDVTDVNLIKKLYKLDVTELAKLEIDLPSLKVHFKSNPNSIDAWEVLADVGETGLANRIDDIEFVDDFIKVESKTPAQVKTLIDEAGGFSAWKLAEAGGSFAKLSTKSSLSTSLFNSLDNALTSAPSIKFNYGSKTLQSPKQFLNATGSDMYDIILSNGAYAKFDKTTGRMLYSDGTNQFFVRYTTGNNVANIEQLINSRVTKLRNCLGLNGTQTIQLTNGLGSATTSPNKVLTFIGKTDETQLLKNQFGDFKHIEVGETPGSVNLLNMPDSYFNGPTWFVDYNKDWMLRGINRGDDFYIASEINISSLYNIKSDGITKYGSYYANELSELVTAGIKPKNISQTNWDNWTSEIIQAAATKY